MKLRPSYHKIARDTAAILQRLAKRNGNGDLSGIRAAKDYQLLTHLRSALECKSLHQIAKPADGSYLLGLSLWNETSVAQIEHAVCLRNVSRFLSDQGATPLSYYEFGSGDGLLASRIIQLLHPTDINNLTVVDVNHKCAERTKDLLLSNGLESDKLRVRIGDYATSRGEPDAIPIGALSNFCSSLHELRPSARWDLIDYALSGPSCTIITELEGRHSDVRFRGEVGYWNSVAYFYEACIRNVSSAFDDKDSVQKCVDNILLPEVARLILGVEPIDMHFQLSDLMNVANERGWSVVDSVRRPVGFGLSAFSVTLIGKHRGNAAINSELVRSQPTEADRPAGYR